MGGIRTHRWAQIMYKGPGKLIRPEGINMGHIYQSQALRWGILVKPAERGPHTRIPMRTYIYIFMYLHLYLYTYAHIFISFIPIFAPMAMSIPVSILQPYLYLCHICLSSYMVTCTFYTHVHIFIYTYIYIYIYIDIFICLCYINTFSLFSYLHNLFL